MDLSKIDLKQKLLWKQEKEKLWK